jgi:hypothetical protein
VGDEEVLAGVTLGVLQHDGVVTIRVGVLLVDIQQGPLGGGDCKGCMAKDELNLLEGRQAVALLTDGGTHGVRSGRHIHVLVASENVHTSDVGLCVTMLRGTWMSTS